MTHEQTPPGYTAAVFRAPLLPALADRVDRLLGHKGEPWTSDIRMRLRGDDLDLFAVASHGNRPVANVWVGASNQCPELGVLGHVYTEPEHRRRGLAAALLRAAVTRFDELGGRWLQLHTGNAAARRLYEAVGFRLILAGESGEADDGDWLMLRGGDEGGVGDAYHESSGDWLLERCGPSHYAGLCVFLNATPGPGKVPLLGIDTGMDAEEKLLDAGLAQGRGETCIAVLLDAANGRPHGLACRTGGEMGIYAPRVAEEQANALCAYLRDR
jgi:GNAT superfamily N-acetyltransferase